MTQAIVLSCASQDADGARRISEALRAAGLEVWIATVHSNTGNFGISANSRNFTCM